MLPPLLDFLKNQGGTNIIVWSVMYAKNNNNNKVNVHQGHLKTKKK